jgi:hypothetical protein
MGAARCPSAKALGYDQAEDVRALRTRKSRPIGSDYLSVLFVVRTFTYRVPNLFPLRFNW